MLKAIRMLNAIENGTTSGAELETLLADDGRYAELSVLVDMPGQARRIASASTTITAMSESALASEILAKSPVAVNALVDDGQALDTMLHAENWYSNNTVSEYLMKFQNIREQITSLKDFFATLNTIGSYTSVCQLTPDTFIFCYHSTYGYAQVIKVNADNTITAGTAVGLISGIIVTSIDVVRLTDSTAFVVGKHGSTTYLVGQVLTVSGTTVTAATHANVISVAAFGSSCIPLSDTKVLCSALAGNTLYAVIATISGTSFSVGSTATVVSNRVPFYAKLSDTKVLVVYANTSDYPLAAYMTISGTTISFGTALQLNAVATNHPIIVQLDDTKALAIFTAGSTYGYVCIVYLGTTLTCGPAVKIHSDTSYSGSLKASKISSTCVLIFYQDTTTTYCRAQMINVNGSTITADDPVTIDSSAAATLTDMAQIEGYRALAVYKNGTTSNGVVRLIGV
jgi:hypothetical protein